MSCNKTDGPGLSYTKRKMYSKTRILTCDPTIKKKNNIFWEVVAR